MTKKTILYASYYALIAIVVGWKAADTLLTGSVLVTKRTTASELTAQKISLESEQRQLEYSLQKENSLAYLGNDTLESFQPITSTINLDPAMTVALR